MPSHKNNAKNIRQGLILLIVMVLCTYALYLRVSNFTKRELTGDELMQIKLTSMPFFDFIKTLPKIEYCSYLSGDYFLVYPFVRIFSYNKWGLVIPHIISTIVGFYLLYLISRLYLKTIWGYLITFSIVCFNATLIPHATVIRTYAVLPTLALATFYLFEKMADSDFKMSLSKKIAAIAFFAIVIWFHVYGIAMVLTCFVYSLGARLYTPADRILVRKSLIFLFFILLTAMPLWFLSVFGPHLSYEIRTNLDPFKFIPNPIVNITGFLKAIFCNLIGYKKLYFLLIGLIFPFFISYKERFRQIAFLLIIVLLPIQLILLADLRTNYWFMQRQFIWVMPLFAFLIGWVWDSFFYQLQPLRRLNP